MSFRRYVVLFTSAVLLTFSPAWGQISSATGAIQGLVTDPQNAVGRVGRQLFGFPYSIISMACFSPGDAGFTATSTSAMGRTREEVFAAIVVDACFGDYELIENGEG